MMTVQLRVYFFGAFCLYLLPYGEDRQKDQLQKRLSYPANDDYHVA
jgi:hypothetical protein